MKPVALIAGDTGDKGVSLGQILSRIFEIRYSADNWATDGRRVAVCFVQAQTVAEAKILMAEVRARTSAGGAAVFCLVGNITYNEKLSLLEAGVADVFTQPWLPEEIVLKAAHISTLNEAQNEAAALRGQIQKLGQYFSADVVQKILSQTGDGQAYGENLDATVFFLDVRNFTTLSETIEPNQVAELLNRLYTDVMDLILSYRGSVNKIIGDALLATFGCPVRGERDARNAVECALAIRETLKIFNETKPSYLATDISIGMGVATGPLFAGTIGSYRKMDYTVIGDTVNIASRLEGLTKQTKFDLIIDSKTRELAGDDLIVRRLKVTRVRGRTKPMEIFLVEGIRESTAEAAGDIFFSGR